jgi:hypothetical protein
MGGRWCLKPVAVVLRDLKSLPQRPVLVSNVSELGPGGPECARSPGPESRTSSPACRIERCLLMHGTPQMLWAEWGFLSEIHCRQIGLGTVQWRDI